MYRMLVTCRTTSKEPYYTECPGTANPWILTSYILGNEDQNCNRWTYLFQDYSRKATLLEYSRIAALASLEIIETF